MPVDHSAASIEALSVEQKAALCLGSDFWHTAPVPEHGIPAITVSDGPHGLRRQPDGGDHTGLGGSLPATCFPTAAALGSSWDPDLAREVGAAIGREARAQDVAVVLGPGINIKRSPLCGRNFEYVSEDPHLSGRIGAGLVEGIQSEGVGACVKHYAANNQETDRVRVSADVDERTLREIYLPAFEHVVTAARPWTVMCAYNKVNGIYASQHRWLLTTVLRDEWGFDGLVMSDWGAVADRVAALEAGLDLEMPPNLGISDRAIVDAVGAGTLDPAVLDTAVERVLALVERAGAREPATMNDDEHHALARRAAAASMVLLRNDGDVLPLRPGTRVAVVGAFAEQPRYQGAGSSQVVTTRLDSPLEALRAAVPGLTYAAGFGIGETTHDAELREEAVGAAAAADVVVAFLGLPADDESEGFDRTHIDLPSSQTELVARLAATGTPVVVVLGNGSAVAVHPWERHAAAVLECWLGGQAVGSAIADVLTGAAEPGGRLAETIPLALADTPSHLAFPGEEGHVRYGEGVFVGYRGFDATGREVSYPFGHGLSYTTFAHRDLTATVDGTDVTVEVTIANTGTRRGKEVVQLYVGDPQSSVPRPPSELKGFAAVELDAGQERRVTFHLGARDLSFWSVLDGGWRCEPGEFDIAIGASSRDLRLHARVAVDVPAARRDLDGTSSLDEWLADPAGERRLREAAPDAPILDDPEMRRVIGNFPLSRFTAFAPMGITADVLKQLGVDFGVD
jgi:beta-glucosidase